MDFRIIKKFCLRKAYKLLLHQKQSYTKLNQKRMKLCGYEIVIINKLPCQRKLS